MDDWEIILLSYVVAPWGSSTTYDVSLPISSINELFWFFWPAFSGSLFRGNKNSNAGQNFPKDREKKLRAGNTKFEYKNYC